MDELVTNRVIREQREATRSLIRLFSDTQQEVEDTIQVIHDSPYIDTINTEEQQEYFQTILWMLRDSGQFIEDVFIYNGEAHTFGTTEAYWISAQAQYWMEDAREHTGEIFWSEPFMDNRTGNMTLAALLHVDEEIGVIGISLDFEEIAKEVDATTIGYSGYVFVYSDGGYRHFTHDEEHIRDYVRRDPLFTQATEESGLLYDELNNYSFPVYYERIPELNLTIYGAVGEEELQAEQEQFQESMLIVLVVALVLASLIALFLSTQLVHVTKVIQQALAKVQEGDLSTRILSYDLPHIWRKKKKMDPYGNELEQIATSFNDTVVRFSEMLKENKQLQWESETDYLTQLPNSRAFEQALEAYHQRHPEAKRALIVLDLDHFKGINDTYGHEAGNEILKQFADLLKREDTAKGTIARYGGEEFIILLPSYTKEKALVYAESLRQAIEKEPFMCHNYLHAEAEEV